MIRNKYIILGGKRFIGRNLCDYIVRQGHEVTSFDQVLPEYRNSEVNYIQGNFFEDNFLREIIDDKDVIIHAISTINPGNSNELYMNGYEKDFVQTVKMCSWIKETEKKLCFFHQVVRCMEVMRGSHYARRFYRGLLIIMEM